MQAHPISRDAQLSLQPLHQTHKLCHLAIGEGAPVAVANQADCDRVLVVLSGDLAAPRHMSAWKLLVPAVSSVHNAIAQPVSIADQEMISQPLIPHAQVLPVD